MIIKLVIITISCVAETKATVLAKSVQTSNNQYENT